MHPICTRTTQQQGGGGVWLPSCLVALVAAAASVAATAAASPSTKVAWVPFGRLFVCRTWGEAWPGSRVLTRVHHPRSGLELCCGVGARGPPGATTLSTATNRMPGGGQAGWQLVGRRPLVGSNWEEGVERLRGSEIGNELKHELVQQAG
ncbi:hypothetical protein V8C86DRAFT_676699 [Haematococcus lacustris]